MKAEANLIAYYPLNETSGTTVRDCSGNGLNGTVLTQHAGMWTAGRFGGGFNTTASAGCIDLGKPASLLLEGSSFTVAAWANAQAFGTSTISYYLVGRTTFPDKAGWRLGTDPGQTWSTKFYDDRDGLTVYSSAANQLANAWTHVALTFARTTPGGAGTGTVTLFVNGVAVESGPYTSIGPDDPATLRIGCRGDGEGYFHGTIDEVRIYSAALSAAQVAALAAKTP